MCSPEYCLRLENGTPSRSADKGARAALILSILLFAVVCRGAAGAQAQPQANGDERFRTLEHQYSVYVMSRFPVVATYLGGSAFDPALATIDGKLRDYSPPALVAEDAELVKYQERFTALAPETLSARRRIDRDVALAEIEFLLHQHQVRRHQERSLDSYVDEPFRGVDWQIQGMTVTGATTLGTDAEWRAVIARASRSPHIMENAQHQLEAGVAHKNPPDWRVLVDFGLRSTLADAEYFERRCPRWPCSDIVSATTVRPWLRISGTAANSMRPRLTSDLRRFVVATFFDNPGAGRRRAASPNTAPTTSLSAQTEYDWALKHNNFGSYDRRRPLLAVMAHRRGHARDQMIALARTIATSHKWQVPARRAAVVRVVFEKLSHDAPKTRRRDGRMVPPDRRGARDLRPRHRSLRRAGGLPARRHRHAAAAALGYRGRRLLPGAAFKQHGRRPFLCHPDR